MSKRQIAVSETRVSRARLSLVLVQLALLSFPQWAHAWGSASTDALSGRAIDADTGLPLEGVNVVYYGSADEGTFTGHGGNKALLFLAEDVSRVDGSFSMPEQKFSPKPFGFSTNYNSSLLYLFKSGYVPSIEFDGSGMFPKLNEILHWPDYKREIKLKRFLGTLKEYSQSRSVTQGPLDDLLMRDHCAWNRIPRLVEAMGWQELVFIEAGIVNFRSSGATAYRDLVYYSDDEYSAKTGCLSLKQFALQHFPALALEPAFHDNDAATALIAFKAGANPNQKFGTRSILSRAICESKWQFLSALLAQSELKMEPPEVGALFFTAASRQPNLLELALDHDINVNGSDNGVHLISCAIGTDLQGRYPNRQPPLMSAIQAGSFPLAQKLIAKGADLDVIDIFGSNALGYATKPRYQRDVVRELIKAGAKPSALVDGWAIVLAQFGRDAELAEQMVRDGLGWHDRLGDQHTLTAIISSEKVELLKFLLDLTPFDQSELLLALGAAAYAKNAEFLKLLKPNIRVLDLATKQKLLERGFCNREIRGELVGWPLMRPFVPVLFDDAIVRTAGACSADDLDAILKLGAKVNTRSKDGRRALTSAVSSRRRENVKKLLSAGADVNLMDQVGNSALMIAADAEFREMALGFKQHPMNYRPLDVMVSNYQKDVSPEIIEDLLDAGADRDAAGKDGWTALMRGAALGCTRCVELLISRGARRDLRNNEGQSALDIARQWARGEVEGILLNQPVR